jgi:chemotaxis-related protein WspB
LGVAVVILEVAGERYGLDVSGVVEVVPAVPLRVIPGVVFGVAGVLRYRGSVVPVVDLGLLWAKRATPSRLSSRIVVLDLDGASGSWADSSGREGRARRRLGVLAERVTRVAHVDPDAAEACEGPKTPESRGLGRLVRDGDALLQLVRADDLVPAEVLASLHREAEAAT